MGAYGVGWVYRIGIAAINTARRFSPCLLLPCLILCATNDLFFAVSLQKCKVSAMQERGGGDKRAAKDIVGDRWGMGFAVMRHACTYTHPHTHIKDNCALHLGCETQTRWARRRISTSSLCLANRNSPISCSNTTQGVKMILFYFIFFKIDKCCAKPKSTHIVPL